MGTLQTASLASCQVLLPALHRMVHQVQREGLRGAALLRLLAGKARCGTPELASCAGRLAWHCHQILLAQVSAWSAPGRPLSPSSVWSPCPSLTS